MSRGQCLECLDIIESKHRHDFVRCECGKSFIDGGDDYLRGGGFLVPVLDALDEHMFDDQGYLDDDFDDYNLGVQAGTMNERERIIKNIKEHVGDLKTCDKKDNCQEFGDLIESYIEEWTNG